MIKKLLSAFLPIIILLGCTQNDEPEKSKNKISKPNKTYKKIDLEKVKEEYKSLNTPEYIEKYIQKVILKGSKGHGFLEEMPGNIVDKETAKLISYYVIELTGRKSTHPKEAKTSQIFYTSNCGSCHGEDGKGNNHTAADLTKKRYFGIEDRKKELEKILNGVRR